MGTQSSSQVLVTGGTGFVGAYCILQLLQQGHVVRTTVRSLDRKAEVLDMLKNGGLENADNLSFIEADLVKDNNWQQAMAGCEYVLHVASPIGLEMPKEENDMIQPAVQGTLRVLKAARDAGVKRVVLTSSFGAVSYGYPKGDRTFTENDWTILDDKTLSPYIKSKAMAEKAAWDFIESESGELELTVINPTGIFGPTLSKRLSSGFEVLNRMLDGSMKACPKISFAVVDVRDVADLHIRAMNNPKAAGQRYIAASSSPPIFLIEMASILREKFKENASNIPTKEIPDFIIRFMALFNPLAKNIVSQLGRIRHASNEKARTSLGWNPRSGRDAVIASMESMKLFL
ncbi:MAG: aldehyde reductase [SAR86 cluster bacterium]|uniref:Aldehyde reductase n=1 Tax=SAR86 cluster bacterium TaxID=2030880 RepID=A0A2A5B0M6_9GAMM|nr:MAG: aldehyde reductase [SAR86 cluster bacterium]